MNAKQSHRVFVFSFLFISVLVSPVSIASVVACEYTNPRIWMQDLANMGVLYLCNFVGGKKMQMPKALEVEKAFRAFQFSLFIKERNF